MAPVIDIFSNSQKEVQEDNFHVNWFYVDMRNVFLQRKLKNKIGTMSKLEGA